MKAQLSLTKEHESLNLATLKKERERANFDIRELTHVLNGGRDFTELYDRVCKQLERDPVFQDDEADLSVMEQKRITMCRLRRLIEYKEMDDLKTFEMRMHVIGLFDPSTHVRFGVHAILFLNTLSQNATDEQLHMWWDDAYHLKTIGCFAMTELGHGSYIQGFETTATFDKDKDEFIINTPTDTATKWWIGGAAHTATVCVCFARLMLDGNDHGIQIFYVPLRNPKDYSLLPGISIGDCGAKMGRNGIDNGWIQFSHVHIPRNYMLMRHAKVSKSGLFNQPPLAQIAYGALIAGRIPIIAFSSSHARKALTIAIRYGAVRRQFPHPDHQVASKQSELQILDYATHKHRLMPILAEAIAIQFAWQNMVASNEEMQRRLKNNDLSLLNDLHATVAGFKAFCTWFGHYAIEQCRQSCGGHGYSSYASLSSMFNDFAVMCTWEGDNTVMAQQTARYLIKSAQKVMAGEHLSGASVAYLGRIHSILESKFSPTTKEALADTRVQMAMFEYCAVRAIYDALMSLQSRVKQGFSYEQAWNDSSVELVECARFHCYKLMAQAFIEAYEKIEDVSIRRILKQLCDLFVWHFLRVRIDVALVGNYITEGSQVHFIRVYIQELCESIREQAIPLVDAFNFSDFVLRSPLGRYDGNVYTYYLDRVKRAPNAQGRAPYWEEVIQPITSRL